MIRRFRAQGSGIEALFLRRAAAALAAFGETGGVLIERGPPEDGLCVVADERLAPALDRSALGLSAEWRPVARSPAQPPPEVGFVGAAVLRDERVGRDRPAEARVSPVAPSPGASEWQCHWFGDGVGQLWLHLRVALRTPADRAALHDLADRWRTAGGAPVRLVTRRLGPFGRHEWRTGNLRHLRPRIPLRATPARAAALLGDVGATRPETVPGPPRPVAMIGASGSGKTAHLARLAVDRIRAGDPVVLFDLHGDLAPAVVAALPPEARGRVVAVDAGEEVGRIPGVDVLGRDADGRDGDLVAALRRLSPDGATIYWGFRIERTLEAFVRLAREEDGSMRDLAALLTDRRRRDASRRSTRQPELARFLDELEVALRRSPDYLDSAAARVARVQSDARVAALVAPEEGGLPLTDLFAEQRSVLFRLPFDQLGPEAASYAASLLATRAYLSALRWGRSRPRGRHLWLVVDEAHLVAPRLLAEAVADGRKFGVIAVVASQYPSRFGPELREAVEGAAATHLVFRVPPAVAPASGRWAGLTARESGEWLTGLPVGSALRSQDGGPPTVVSGPPMRTDGLPWAARVASTADRYAPGPVASDDEERLERTLWQVVQAAERRTRLAPGEIGQVEVERLRRRGWVEGAADAPVPTSAGRAYLGLGVGTGAVSESAEHRRLLYEAQRIFARHGERLEVVLQGRFDLRLPDGRLRLEAEVPGGATPAERWQRLEERRRSWAWRAFGGRDVHVEAEVTGADRAERIRRGLAKAAAQGAFVVFVVGDARRARRVRGVIERTPGGRDAAQVWTIPRRATGGDAEADR